MPGVADSPEHPTDLDVLETALKVIGCPSRVWIQHDRGTPVPKAGHTRLGLGGPSNFVFDLHGKFLGWYYMGTDECENFKEAKRS